MSDLTRQHLLGYLLNAIEPDERAVVEQRLGEEESYRRELDILRCSLDPLACDPLHHDVPPGLAQRCCEYVFSRIEVMPAALSATETVATGRPRRWSWLDLSVAGAIAAAVAVLIVPAIYQSHVHSQIVQCQKNLSDIGTALASYSDRHGGYYPVANRASPTAPGADWVAQLVAERYLEPRSFVCPTAGAGAAPQFSLDGQPNVQIPLPKGMFGLTLPYRDANGAVPLKSQNYEGVLVTEPPAGVGKLSPNHADLGQPALMKDGSTPFLRSTKVLGSDDDISTNDSGQVELGLRRGDSVFKPLDPDPKK